MLPVREQPSDQVVFASTDISVATGRYAHVSSKAGKRESGSLGRALRTT